MQSEISYTYIILSAIIFIIIIAVIILFAVFSNKKNDLIQAKLQSQLQHQEQLYEMRLKALRSQLNPHFIHNSINAILYYIQQNDMDSSEYYLAKFSKLMRQFFEYSNFQDLTLSEEVEFLNNYLQLEKLRFEEKLNYTIKVDPTLDTNETLIPCMVLQPIIENAINHGIFHQPNGGFVNIHFINDEEPNTFSVTVTDNGIGVNKSKALKTQRKSRMHSGIVLEERLKLLKASQNTNVNYTIEDLSETQNTTGTKVQLTFKYTD